MKCDIISLVKTYLLLSYTFLGVLLGFRCIKKYGGAANANKRNQRSNNCRVSITRR